MSNGSPPTSDPIDQVLERIASALGCPVEALTTGEGLDVALTQADELLRLWSEIASDEARAQILDLARTLAGQ